ncbi:MAG: right-handed parallel beta-helix repeat-containing protein [Clostridia bacterium]|nr:right-handed parallel beta-helix repeat-containing protein [Clostridia bacterium]
MIYHVSIYGNDNNMGTAEAPFRTINHAAQIALAGDTVRVHEGTYREWVKPENGGTENNRIVYEAAPGEHPIIKGSEIVTDWERVEGTVWKKTLPNTMFGDWNPYFERVNGDWIVNPTETKNGYYVHLGDVYLNGVSMYEAISMEDLYTASTRYDGWQVGLGVTIEPILRPEQTIYRWFAEVSEDTTTIFCNFQEFDPNENTVEINVRKCCFYPTKNYLNYITLRGFEIAHAACPFTPPTANQIGMVGPNWAKGWIIEDNDMHDAKCSAISIGKEASTGDNDWTCFHQKYSHYYQTEAVFRALVHANWNKETIGSHIIRNNRLHDCGQNGVVGHLGCIFSRIEHNEIYNIAVKHEFFGHEIGGIKLHAAIDVVIENNNIHNCTRGTWLDWQAQGTRVTKNIYHHNDRDLYVEVTHGPCLVDNNLFLSEKNLEDHAQGTALVHNVIAGNSNQRKILERETPYHFPHSTQVLGVSKLFGGDNRIMNNLMLGMYPSSTQAWNPMSASYNDFIPPEDYYAKMTAGEFHNDNRHWQAMWVEENAYSGYASAFRAEKKPIFADGMSAEVEEKDGEWILTINVPEAVVFASCEPVTTERLGVPVFTEEPYENPDGTPVDFTKDLLGNTRKSAVIPGPFAELTAGKQTIKVWKQ